MSATQFPKRMPFNKLIALMPHPPPPINLALIQMPASSRLEVDLAKLFVQVLHNGGSGEVTLRKFWAMIGRTFNPPPQMTDLSFKTKNIFVSKLLPLEEAYAAGEACVDQLEEIFTNLPRPSSIHPLDLSGTLAHVQRSGLQNRSFSRYAQEVEVPGQRSRLFSDIHNSSESDRGTLHAVFPVSGPVLCTPSIGLGTNFLSTGCRVGLWSRTHGLYKFGAVIGRDPTSGLHWVHFDEGNRGPLNENKDVWVGIDITPKSLAPPNSTSMQMDIGGSNSNSLEYSERNLVYKSKGFAVYRSVVGPPGYEIYAKFPNLKANDINIRAHSRGAVYIKVRSMSSDLRRRPLFETIEVVELPSKLETKSASALLTEGGQLFIRVAESQLLNDIEHKS